MESRRVKSNFYPVKFYFVTERNNYLTRKINSNRWRFLLLFLLFSFLCTGNLLYAKFHDDRPAIEKEIAFAEYKYHSGYYEEAAWYARQLLDRLEKEQETEAEAFHYRMRARMLLVRSYEARLLFEKANEIVNETIEIAEADKENAVGVYLYLGEYLAQTGQSLKAGELYEKGMSAGTASPDEKLLYELLYAEIALGKGYTLAALESLLQQESAWLQLISAEGASIGKTDKERYSRFLNLKTIAHIRNGQFGEAEKNILYSKEWINASIGKSDRIYTSLLETEALLFEAKGEAEKLPSLYANAYFLHPASDYETKKIYFLCKTAVHNLHTGDLITFGKYLRKLRMNAEQYAGKADLSHFAYQYVLSYQLYHEGDFTKALSLLEKLMNRFSFLPAYHPFLQLAESLQSDIYLKGWMLPEYENSLERSEQKSVLLHGEDSPVTDRVRLKQAMFEIVYGTDYKQAREIFRASYYDGLVKHIGSNSPAHLQYLRSLGDLYSKTENYDSAVAKSVQLRQLSSSLFGEKSLQYVLAASRDYYYKLAAGRPKEVLAGLPELLQLEKALTGSSLTRKKRGEALYLISEITQLTGEVELSRSYSLRALDLLQYQGSSESLFELNIWEQAASLYMQTGNYYKAESLLQKSLNVKRRHLEEDSPLLLSVYSRLGMLYTSTGNYGEADKYLKLFSEKTNGLSGTNSLLYSKSQLLYGDYYTALGDFRKAEEKYTNAIRLQTSILGKDHLLIASGMMKLASATSRLSSERMGENEKTYRDAGAIIDKAIGKQNAFYVEYLQKIAGFFIYSGRYTEAKGLLEEAGKYWNDKLGSSNKYSADIAALQGDASYYLSEYAEAEKQYQKAGEIYTDIFSKQHPLYAKVTGKIARVYYMQHDLTRSVKTMEEVVPVYLNYTEKHFSSLSFSEKEKFWYSLKEEFEFYTFLVLGNLSGSKPELNGRIYDQIISTKALLLSSDIKLRQRITASGDTSLIRMFDEWVGQREFITSAVSLSKSQLSEQGINLEKEIERMEHLEKSMSSRSNAFNESRKNRQIYWRDILDILAPNEYAVELVRFRYFDKVFTDSVIYAALILNEKFKNYPKLALMPEGKLMEQKFLNHYRNSVVFNTEDNYSYQVFWEPIKSFIPDSSIIYLSAEGVYNQINPEMIPLPDNSGYVLDANDIIPVTNTKDLLNTKEKEKKNSIVQNDYYVLCGNPVFYSAEKTGNIASLPGAEREVRDIHSLLKGTDRTILCLLNKQVTEDTVKQMISPVIFHIATHGYFVGEEGKKKDNFASNPLLNSGLILCGGGDILEHSESSYVNAQPGILTAYEVLNLNFDQTQLVVLSACETGRGMVQTGEGVFGLQRSFLIAGADAVVMSLFKVNDEVTREFMLILYENLIRTGDKRQSFLIAKETIRKEYDKPIYWGAFIMIEINPKGN